MPPSKGTVQVRQLPVGPMANFVYLLVEEKTGEALVVDSGWETGPIVSAARDAGARVKYIVATHEHFDHSATLRELADEVGGEVVAHRDSPLSCDRRVGEGDELLIGREKVKVLHTPGHTEDSICLFDGKNVFTGDTLFIGNIGKFERGMAEVMFHSLHDVIAKLPGRTQVCPGHDYGEVPGRTLGEEVKLNPFLGPGDLRTFLALFS